MAYPIKKRTSGIYYCVEFQTETGAVIDDLELAFRRDERIMRFLSVKLDKYGVKYNDDKRNGLIGKKKPAASKDAAPQKEVRKKVTPKPAAKPVAKAAPAPAPVVVAEEEE